MSQPARFRITIEINAEKVFNVISLRGREALGAPFYFVIQILTDNKISFLLQTARLNLSSNRTLCGVITQVTRQPFDHQQDLLQLIFQPRLSLLERSNHSRVFVDHSIIDITKVLLNEAGYLVSQIQMKFFNKYLNRPYVLQPPNENDLTFLLRLLAKAGIFFWHETDISGNEKIWLTDQSLSCDSMKNLASQELFSALHVISDIGISDFSVIDHDEMHPSVLINNKQKNYSFKNFKTHITSYGAHALSYDQAEQLNKLNISQQQNFSQQLLGFGNHLELSIGRFVYLNAGLINDNLAGDYLILEIEHAVQQNIESATTEQNYENRVKLLSRKIPFHLPVPSHPAVPSLFHAVIESNNEYAFIDEQGCYRLRQKFDRSNTIATQASPFIPRLQPYGGNPNGTQYSATGLHFPLLNGAEVLVGCINGDPDRPIIYGSVPNIQQTSPVNNKNNTQHRIVSKAGHELKMEDRKGETYIQLMTVNAFNLIKMDATTDAHQLTLMTQQGKMLWQAGQDISVQNADSATEVIGNKKIVMVEKNYLLQTQLEDLEQAAATTQQFSAQQNYVQQTQQNFEARSEGGQNWQAQQNILLRANGNKVQFKTNQQAILKSAKAITLIGTGQGIIEFSQGRAGLQITPDGNVNFFADSIISLSANPVQFQGNVNYIDSPGPPMQFTQI